MEDTLAEFSKGSAHTFDRDAMVIHMKRTWIKWVKWVNGLSSIDFAILVVLVCVSGHVFGATVLAVANGLG